MSKKKKHRKANFSKVRQHKELEGVSVGVFGAVRDIPGEGPFAQGGAQDSHPAPAVPSPQRSLEVCPGQVRLFGPLPPYPFLKWISEYEARDLIRLRKVFVRRASKQMRGVQMREMEVVAQKPEREPDKTVPIRRSGLGDSHDHETDLNRSRCWTFDPLPLTREGDERPWVRRLFRAVTDSCVKKAA